MGDKIHEGGAAPIYFGRELLTFIIDNAQPANRKTLWRQRLNQFDRDIFGPFKERDFQIGYIGGRHKK